MYMKAEWKYNFMKYCKLTFASLYIYAYVQ